MKKFKLNYTTADKTQVCVKVTREVKEVIEQTDRKIESQKRQDRRYLAREEYQDGFTDTTVLYPQENLPEFIDKMDRNNQLYSAIDTLSETQKRRIYLHYFVGLSYREIGKREGVNFKTVSESIKLAIQNLKKYFDSNQL